MMQVKYYKCPSCNKKFKTLSGWGDHVDKMHPGTRPKGYSISRYFYYTVTGKTNGICRTCKKPTDWNESSMKYNQYCSNPDCKKAYVKIAKQRMVGKYGKVHLLDDPDVQKKMLANRKISGKYRFDDGVLFEYTAKYERNFLEMLDTMLEWPSNDLMSPSPHIYYYNYENPKDDKKNWGKKFYIPDFYIPSLNLEIEIKQQTTTNQAFIDINRVKEALKDEVMKSNKNVNYLKINDNNFTEFFEYLMKSKEMIPERKDEIQKGELAVSTEACKDVDSARDFLKKVDKLSKKYDANFFIVTDGASMTRTGRGETPSAIYNARNAQKQWERENGFDPDEDWIKDKITTEGFIKDKINERKQKKALENKLRTERIRRAIPVVKKASLELKQIVRSLHGRIKNEQEWKFKPDIGDDFYQIDFEFEVLNDEDKQRLRKEVLRIKNKYEKQFKEYGIWIDEYAFRKNNLLTLGTNGDLYYQGNKKFDLVMEEAMYSSKNRYPIFLIFTYTGGTLSKIIKPVTQSEFSHAMIAFDPELKECWSMSERLKDNHEGGLYTGREKYGLVNFTYDSYYYKHMVAESYYSVYVMYVSKEVRDKMISRVKYLAEHEQEIRFNQLGLVTGGGFRIKDTRDNMKFFCSQLVADILRSGMNMNLHPSVTRPADLTELDNISLVNHGLDFTKYDPKITRRNMRLVREKKYNNVEFEYAQESSNLQNEIPIDRINQWLKDNGYKSGIKTIGDWGLKKFKSGETDTLFIISHPDYKKIMLGLRKLVSKPYFVKIDNYNTVFLKKKGD